MTAEKPVAKDAKEKETDRRRPIPITEAFVHKTKRSLKVSSSGLPNLIPNVHCGDCIFYKRMRNSAFAEPCSKLGVMPKNDPCRRFAAAPEQFNFRSDKTLRLFAKVIAKMGRDMLPLIASVMMREAKTRKKGFSFGQPVYLRAFGGDFRSNYRKAFIVFIDRKLAYLSDGFNKDGSYFTASVAYDSLLTEEQWEAKKARLETRKLLKDPKLLEYTTVVGTKDPLEGYVPPTIDSDFSRDNKKRHGLRSKTNYVTINHSDRVDEVFQARGTTAR